MANATSRVGEGSVPWTETGIHRVPAATTATYYPGAMIATDASGNAVKCDNTSGIVFDGINVNSARVQINSDDTVALMKLDQSKQITVDRPMRFAMDIAAAVDTDIGRAVYAAYDNEVSYSQTNSILVGWVDQVLTATRVLIKPAYAPLTNLAVSSNTLTFTGTTGANTIVVPDNEAIGLAVVEGSNHYLDVVTTNSAERLLASKSLSFLDSVGTMYGTGEDVVVSWDGTRLNVTQAATNSEIRWGVDGAGIDQRFYGDTASAYMLWDQSADQLILGGVATVSGLRVGTGGATAITTTRAVTKADSGGVFTVAQSSAYTITCATPGGAGERYLFQLVSPGANDVSIVATGCTFEGSIAIDGATIVATGSTLKFATGASLLGDTIELISTSATKFLVRAFASGAGGITIT